jgi:hypothetical protein
MGRAGTGQRPGTHSSPGRAVIALCLLVAPVPGQGPSPVACLAGPGSRPHLRPRRPGPPPAGAPNVLLILLDDAGYGAMGTFGGPTSTPTADRLAAGGLTYNRFHVTALCAPSRQCLLTGRNHHAVGMGTITELATSAPGYSSVRPNSAVTWNLL